MIDFYNATMATPWIAAERGDIEPRDHPRPRPSRPEPLRAKRVQRNPRKHHPLPL